MLHSFQPGFVVMSVHYIHMRIVLWTGRERKNASTSFKNEDKLTKTIRNEMKWKKERLDWNEKNKSRKKNECGLDPPPMRLSHGNHHTWRPKEFKSSIELMGWKECCMNIDVDIYIYIHCGGVYGQMNDGIFHSTIFWPIPGKGRRFDAPHRWKPWIEQK